MLGNKNNYTIEYLNKVIKEDISILPKKIKNVIKNAIEIRLVKDPIGFGKPLQFSLKGHRRLRVGNYRIVYRIENDCNKILIVAIKHRKNVYEKNIILRTKKFPATSIQ
jgi:addiction module RelE/StbE family toxin